MNLAIIRLGFLITYPYSDNYSLLLKIHFQVINICRQRWLKGGGGGTSPSLENGGDVDSPPLVPLILISRVDQRLDGKWTFSYFNFF